MLFEEREQSLEMQVVTQIPASMSVFLPSLVPGNTCCILAMFSKAKKLD